MSGSAALKRKVKRSGALLACTARRHIPKGVRTLLYHSVSTDTAYRDDQMTVGPEQFEMQLRLIPELGFTVREAHWVVDRLRRGVPVPERTVVVTFDDGLVDFYETAYPIIRKVGYPVTVFLVAEAVERGVTRGHSWPAGYMRRQQLLDLRRDGLVTFGAHGFTHEPLGSMTDATLRSEVDRSRHALEAVVGEPIELFAYPFGERDMWDARIRSAVEGAGFMGAYTSVIGVDGNGADPYRLRRSRVSWTDDRAGIELLLRGCFDWYGRFQRVRAAMPRRLSKQL